MNILEAVNLHINYGDIPALCEVSFEVKEREIVSIVGSNGAGKSTLLKAIAGFLPIFRGTLVFYGKQINSLLPHKRVAFGIIRVPEGRRLFPRMTVLENLELGAYLRNKKAKSNEILERVYQLFPIIFERRRQMAGTLSGGEQQMLAIARGLMSNPRLLMMDEPSLGLAPIITDLILRTIKEINTQGITILLVEQNVYESLSLSSMGYVLENGRITIQGKGSELLNNELIRAAYLGL